MISRSNQAEYNRVEAMKEVMKVVGLQPNLLANMKNGKEAGEFLTGMADALIAYFTEVPSQQG